MPKYALQWPSGPALIPGNTRLQSLWRGEPRVTATGRIPLRITALVLLVVSIGISPRIPLPINVPGRQFDLRVEDLILVALLLTYLIWFSVYQQIDPTVLAPSLVLYSSIIVASTSLAVVTQGLDPLRGTFYVLKAFEYFLIFFIVANWVRTIRELRVVVIAIMTVGAANVAWVIAQVVNQNYQTLFNVSADYIPSYMFHTYVWRNYYGPALIGELSPYATGGFFVLLLLLVLGFVLFPASAKRKGVSACLCSSFAICAFLSGSRSAAAVAVVGAAVMLFLARRIRSLVALAVISLLIIGALAQLNKTHLYAQYVNERWSALRIQDGVNDRQREYWGPMLGLGYEHFWTGMGTGSLGFVPGTRTEAHDGYLRVFLESGIFGLLAFLWLLFKIARWAARTWRTSRSAVGRAVSGAVLGATVGLSLAALVQDVFVTVVTNEIYWVMVGLTMAAYRIEGAARTRA